MIRFFLRWVAYRRKPKCDPSPSQQVAGNCTLRLTVLSHVGDTEPYLPVRVSIPCRVDAISGDVTAVLRLRDLLKTLIDEGVAQ